ncbi:MAG: aldo/keto reductase [Candidatus Eremiobacteraeota bacterium]|nr:aldo/keto reductase [Candidatus Eremiobacteraeota bacterium]
MRTKIFGKDGPPVPAIGQGTWDIPESGPRLDEAKRAIRRGIELGMVHLDTAEMYGSGRVEELLGEAIAGIAREKLFIGSKVLPGNADYKGTIAACDRSLARMRLEYLDLYMLHWPSSEPLEETMRALEALVKAGKTRYVGVSNFDVDELAQARSYLRTEKLACNQILYHLKERSIEFRLQPYCEREGIAIVAYTPFGRGRFPREGAGANGVLGKIAAKHHGTPRQVILNFLIRQSNVFTIPKASSVAHVEENAAADAFTLDDSDVAAIDRAFPAHDGPLASL